MNVLKRRSSFLCGSMAQPEAELGAQFGAQLVTQPGAQLAVQPGAQLAALPGAQLAVQPGAQLAVQPGAQHAALPGAQLAAQPGAQLAAQPGSQLAVQPGAQLAALPGAQLAVQPGAQLVAQPGAQLAAQPGAQLAAQPGTQLAAQPGIQLAAQPGAQPVAAVVQEKWRILKFHEDELLFAMKNQDASWVCQKLYERAVISEEVKDKFSTLDHGSLQQELMVRYLLQHVYDRVRNDERLIYSFMDILREVDIRVVGELKKELLLSELAQKKEEGGAVREEFKLSVGDYRLCEDDVPLLSELLAPGAYKSRLLGVSLKLSEAQIAECLRERSVKVGLCNILREWISSNSMVCTLNQLKNALSSSLVCLHRISEILDEKFVPQRGTLLNNIKSQSLIVYQSGGRKVALGKSALLGFEVSSTSTVSYQWIKNGEPLSDNELHSGVNTAYLFISQVERLSEGQYQCTTNIISSDTFNLVVSLPDITNHFISIYSKIPKVSLDSWPLTSNVQFVRLALIEKGRPPINDQYSYAIQGDMDDIVSSKEEIGYNEVFGQYQSGALVLVEGRPGSGKTTLMHKVTTDWALKGNILVGAEIVLLVPLRFFSRYARIELSHLFKSFIENDSKQFEVIENLKEKSGKGLCIIIDGLDEYKFQDPNDLVLDLINKVTLPLAMVIVASRPVGTASIRQQSKVTLRIEVLGFKREEITKYIHNYFKNNGNLADKLVAYLDQHINIHRMCYLPVHVNMICQLYSKYGEKIPHYETKVYESFTMLTLLRKLNQSSGRVRRTSLDNLPDDIKEYFHNICHLAFDMIIQSEQIIFETQTKFPLSPPGCDTSSLGLVTIDSTAELFGMEDLYCFHHLTFQEYLAAFHMKTQKEELVIEMTKQSKSKLHMVWKFYFGMVQFTPDSLILKHIMSNTNLDNLYQIQCAFESQQQICCDSIIELVEFNSLSFKGHNLVPVDLLAMSYVISTTQNQCTKLYFQNCSFDKEGIVLFLSKLSSRHLLSIKYLCYCYKNCTLLQLKVLNILLRKLTSLEALDLGNIEMGVDGIKTLTENVELANLATLKIKMPLKRGKNIDCRVLKLLRFKSSQELILHYTCSESKSFDDTCMFLFKLKCAFDCFFNTNYKLLICFKAIAMNSLLLHSTFGFDECSKVIFVNCRLTNNLQSLELVNIHAEMYILDFKSDIVSKSCDSCVKYGSEYYESFKFTMVKVIKDINGFSFSNVLNDNYLLNLSVFSALPSNIGFELCGTNSLGKLDSELTKHPTNSKGVIKIIHHCKTALALLAELEINSVQNEKFNFFHIFWNCYLFQVGLGNPSCVFKVLNCMFEQCTKLQSLSIQIDSIDKAVAVGTANWLKSCSDLQMLNFSCNCIDSTGAEALAEGLKSCDGLHTLDLSQNSISLDCATALCHGLKCLNLHTLNLSKNNIGSEGVITIANEFLQFTRLETLNLHSNKYTFLTDGLKHMTSLKLLDEKNSIVSDDEVGVVRQCTSCSNILCLNLNFNGIGLVGVKRLVKQLKTCTNLQELHLSMNYIGSDGITFLAGGVKNCTNLHTLDLCFNQIGSEGVLTLVGVLKHCKLQILQLSDNMICSEGAVAIARELNCSHLRTVNLSNNKICSKGAIALADELQHCSNLQSVNLKGNVIGHYGALALADRLKSRSHF